MKSLAEMTLAAQLEMARIPFERQYRFNPERKHRADFIIFGATTRNADCLLIEVDGGTWMAGRHNRGSSIPAEFEKGALAAIAGYRVIHCTTEQVNSGTCYRWITEARERAA